MRVSTNAAAAFALAALLPAGPVAAQVPVSAAAPDLRHERALTLARTVQSREIAVDAAMQAADAQFVEGMLAVPDVKALEALHPGVVRAMWDGSKDVLQTELAASLPELWTALAGVYEKLTAEQLDAALAFYGGPLGQKLLLTANRKADVRDIMAGAARDAQYKITSANLNSVVNRAAAASMNSFSAAEQREIAAFAASPAGLAIQRLQEDINRVTEAWTNKEDPASDAKVEAAMTAAAQAFIAAHDGKKKKG